MPRTARFSAIGIEAGAAKENRAFRSARTTSAPTRVTTVTNSSAVIAEAEALVADEAPGARIDGRTGERRMPRTATPVVTTKDVPSSPLTRPNAASDPCSRNHALISGTSAWFAEARRTEARANGIVAAMKKASVRPLAPKRAAIVASTANPVRTPAAASAAIPLEVRARPCRPRAGPSSAGGSVAPVVRPRRPGPPRNGPNPTGTASS